MIGVRLGAVVSVCCLMGGCAGDRAAAFLPSAGDSWLGGLAVQGDGPGTRAGAGPREVSREGGGLGLLNAPIAAVLNADDRRRALHAQIDALEAAAPGAPAGWQNPTTGRHGTIVVGPLYDSHGRKCRGYTHTVYSGRRPIFGRGTACRGPDGAWGPQT